MTNLKEDVALYFTDAINLSIELARTVENIPEPQKILEALPESMISGRIKLMAQALSKQVRATDTVTAMHINKITDLSLNADVEFESYSAPYARSHTASRTDQLIHEKVAFLVASADTTQGSMRRGGHQLPLTYAEKRAQKLNGPTIHIQPRLEAQNEYAVSQPSLAIPKFQHPFKTAQKSNKRESGASSPRPHQRTRLDGHGGYAASHSRSTSVANTEPQRFFRSEDEDDDDYIPIPRSVISDAKGEKRYEWPTPTMPNQQAPLNTDHTGLVWKYVMPSSGRKWPVMRAIARNLNIGLAGSKSNDELVDHLENHINSNQLGYSQVGLDYGKMVPESSGEGPIE